MKNRIFELMKSKGKNQSEFAESIQISNAVLSSIRSGRTNPTLLVIENIKQKYPDVNLEWLFTGEGNMYIGKEPEAREQMLKEETPEQLRTEDPAEYGVENTQKTDCDDQKTVVAQEKTAAEVKNEQPEQPKVMPFVTTAQKGSRNVRQVIIMYDDGTYETLQK